MAFSKIVPKKKCLPVLESLYTVTLLVSQLLSYRFVVIGNVLTVASVFIIPITYSVSDLIAEQYGYDTIKKVIFRSLPVLFFASLLLYLAQELPVVKQYEQYQSAYYNVFHPIIRIYFSNFIAIWLGIILNSYILVKWKMLVKGKIFFIRSFCSSVIGELIFTAIVVTLVQYGVSSWKNIGEMILVSFSVKVFFSFFSAIIAAFVKPVLYSIDGCDAFEVTANYNPFKFTANGIQMRSNKLAKGHKFGDS